MMGAFGPKLWEVLARWMPYDLAETDDEYIATVALPGFDADEIDVFVKDKTISIEAKRKAVEGEGTEERGTDTPPNTPEVHKIVSMGEIFWGRPEITVEIPVDNPIVPDKVKAKLKKGLLEVRFQKVPGTKIKVEEDSSN
jgi:HSP20 family molecular chaperone IbpA